MQQKSARPILGLFIHVPPGPRTGSSSSSCCTAKRCSPSPSATEVFISLIIIKRRKAASAPHATRWVRPKFLCDQIVRETACESCTSFRPSPRGAAADTATPASRATPKILVTKILVPTASTKTASTKTAPRASSKTTTRRSTSSDA